MVGEVVPVEVLPRLRPEPWPVTPLGPYRLLPSGKLERFPSRGPAVIRWIEEHCVFTDGQWVGQPFRLLPWQKQLLIDLFEMVYDPALGRWRRRYRTAYIGVPKKQGKTELAGALAAYFLLAAGEPSPGIAVAAAADYQADLVYRVAATMFELPGAPLEGRADVFAREILLPGEPNARIRRVAAAGGKLDGMKLLVAICDEVHEWQSPSQRKVYGMLRGALALRDEPLHLSITTAGEDDGEQDEDELAPWLRLYRLGRRIESGEVRDEAFLFRWWMAPPGCDHRDRSLYRSPAVNPSFGVTVQEAFYVDELGKRAEADMRRYYLNQPVETLNVWLEHGTWESCCVPGLELDPAGEVVMGWDASTKRDSTAVALAQWQEIDGVRRLAVKLRTWERPYSADGGEADWKVPRGEVIEYITQVGVDLNVRAIAYDPWALAWVVEELEDRGLPLVEVPQNDMRMAPATQALYELISEGVLAHDGDPVLARHMRSARVKSLPRGGQRLVKGRRGRVIDGAIAVALAVGEAMLPREPEGSFEVILV